MLAGDIDLEDGMQNGYDFSNGLVTDDVLLCRSLTRLRNEVPPPNSMSDQTRRKQFSHDQDASPSLLGSCSIVTREGQLPGNNNVVPADNYQMPALSEKELDRRQKLKERKRVQRQNQDFAERERLRARGRIKALREDPTFRQFERQRDRERRRKARLLNQSQRIQERDRDKVRKSMMRSLITQSKATLLQKENECEQSNGGCLE